MGLELVFVTFVICMIIFNLGNIVYSLYFQEEEIETVRIYANGELYTCWVIRNDSYDLCNSTSGKQAYKGELT